MSGLSGRDICTDLWLKHMCSLRCGKHQHHEQRYQLYRLLSRYFSTKCRRPCLYSLSSWIYIIIGSHELYQLPDGFLRALIERHNMPAL